MSHYHILTYDELLKVNGGSGNDSDDSDDETVGSESEESSDEGAETATESTTGQEGVGEPSADPTSESTSSGTNSESENGGHEIENTVEAVANAEVGDTLTRDDGTEVTITQGDIDWAQEHCGSYGKSGEEEKEESPAKESDLPSAEEADCSKTEQEEGGSRRIENTDEAVANAKPGDTLVRDDGTVVTLKEIDIEQAQEKLGIGEHKEDEKSPSKEGELAEKSSGENKNAKGENAANLPSDYKNYPVSPDYSEERAYINSKLDTPKGNNVAGTAVDLLNNTSTCTGVAGELAAQAAKTNLIDAPVLNEFAGNMSKLGNAVIVVDFAYTSYQNAKAYQNGEMSYWQSAYNTLSHVISVTAGAKVGATIAECGSTGTFGIGAVPAIMGGAVAGAATTAGCELLFDKLEEQIWGEAK